MAAETDKDGIKIPSFKEGDCMETYEGVKMRVPGGYRQTKAGDLFQISRHQYVANRKANVRGTANPSIMNNPSWIYQVGPKGLSALDARTFFGIDENPLLYPVWSFVRWGATRTKLPDGRLICIGGAHEDYYDPDFYIYNDVVAYDAPQKTNPSRLLTPECINIYGYPVDVFPPTDYHTSTYYADSKTGKEMIFIIGGIGYPGQASRDRTDIYKLDLSDFSIHRVETSGIGPLGPTHHYNQHKTELLIEDEQPVIRITTKPEVKKRPVRMAAGKDVTGIAKIDGKLVVVENDESGTTTRDGEKSVATEENKVFTLRISDMRWI